MNAKQTREFRIEGHGRSTLAMVGGVASHRNPYVREPLLTRKEAWEIVKTWANVEKRNYHTIKVYKGGTVVFQAFQQSDGSFIDMKSCKKI